MIEVYESLLDVPLDEPPAQDGDDTLVPGAEGDRYITIDPLQLIAAPGHEVMVVPFRGPLKFGMRGRHVLALKRALSRAGYLRWMPFTTYFGVRTRDALRKFQTKNGLAATGVYDYRTHQKLARFYDAYAIRHLLVDPADAKDEAQRKAFLAEIMYLYNRRYSIRYSQARPFDARRPPWALDCSATGEWCGHYSGLGSLSGYPSVGYGNTDTQLSRFRSKGWMRASINSCRVGDPVYYGRGMDPSHVSFFIGRKDGLNRTASFGSYPMRILPHNYRSDLIAMCNLTGH